MRIVLSLLHFRPGKIGGAETYLRQLLRHMPAHLGDDKLIVVADREVAGAVENGGWEWAVVADPPRRVLLQRCLEAFTPWRARAMEQLFSQLQPDVVMMPQQSIFPIGLPCPCVLTVVDVQHLFFPHYFSAFDRAFRARAYTRSLARADHIIAISEFTRGSLIERCRQPADKVTAIQLGYEAKTDVTPAPVASIPTPYLYYPAATMAHKGHRTLIDTLAQLHARNQLQHHLVLTGMRTPLWKSLQQQITARGLADRVTHLGFVSYAQVQMLLRNADAVVFPSEFEGFGLPVVEAATLDKKVITSKLEVFDEIGVPRSFQIDFSDPQQLLAALALPGPTRLLHPPLSWSQTAQRTLDVLRCVARAPQPARP